MTDQNNTLIQIQEKNGQNVVSARELYIGLGYNLAHWKRWSKKNIINSDDFIEYEDYEGFTLMVNGNEVQDFIVTLDMAKELTMLSRTKKGKEIRKYFIAKEKEVQALKLQVVELHNKQLQEQQNKIEALEDKFKVLQIESGLQSGHMTIKGFATSTKTKLERKDYQALGKFASRVCRKNSLEMGHIPHPEFGSVKTYPTNILRRVFKSYLG